MANAEAKFYQISGDDISLILGGNGCEMPRCIHFGKTGEAPELHLSEPRARPASPDIPIAASFFPQHGRGCFSEPALAGFFGGQPWETDFGIKHVVDSATTLEFHCEDSLHPLSLGLSFAICPLSGVVEASARLTNDSAEDFHLSKLAALALPLPSWVEEARFFRGSWANEAHVEAMKLCTGMIERATRDGRPGFNWSQFMLLTDGETADSTGNVLGLHFAWSGNHRFQVERTTDGDSHIHLSEWIAPGEVILRPGETYSTPVALIAHSEAGLNGIRNRYHKYARTNLGHSLDRPAQINTWEAVYFDVDEQTVGEIANAAAPLGFERLVLDDGWFKGRHHDQSSLGDWMPDPDKFPDGLTSVIQSSEELGMSFGLWVEPEMINPDSDLYRAHPDWAIVIPGAGRPTGRNQLVLNLTNPAVTDYLFEILDSLLKNHRISYIKWDCNRQLYPGSTANGPIYHRQVAALYKLLSKLKSDHPNVSIESCASGGGRIDYGILRFADRVWPSDNNDALDRVRIQRHLSLFLPLEFIGAHVGPSPAKITGNVRPMTFRCLVALFGHFGAELDPRLLSAEEAQHLQQAVSVYKEYRHILHGGQHVCLPGDAGTEDIQLIVNGGTSEAILRVLNLQHSSRNLLIDLSQYLADAEYTLSEIYPGIVKQAHIETTTVPFSVSLPPGPSGKLFYLKRHAR